MANSKELVLSDSVGCPEFIQDLLPSAERTALLYHLSYLCLGGFPRLESLIRERALETQTLFASSGAVLLKCVSTSNNLVKSLFPMLMHAVENNEPSVAVKHLEKARSWIHDIIKDVEDMVYRYEHHNLSVASCTSDVFQEQSDNENQLVEHSDHIKNLNKAIQKLDEEMKKTVQDVANLEKKIEEKNAELERHLEHTSKKSNGMSIMAALVPFFGLLIKFIVDAATVPGEAAKTQSLKADLSRLTNEKRDLQNKEWDIHVKQTELELELASAKIHLGVIPDPVHLKDVQKCLSQIQQILVDLKKFWEKVASLLDSLQNKTFVAEDLIDELSDMKDDFLMSIEVAEECWARFGSSCQKAQAIFSVQFVDEYKFLDISPSSLTAAQRQQQHDFILNKLNHINTRASLK
ncbi:uncharacterized protein LOC130218519 [Danio aesculapii]|uniref:uncharacterized protein LOC130218519 n=1 Tax=Danio aesculapii TaxID=1142201 RepID=UPI0024BFE3AC|nr:uncharacterized protein LOC130218519 [Danio aesculapii]